MWHWQEKRCGFSCTGVCVEMARLARARVCLCVDIEAVMFAGGVSYEA
jgi:hypothetical protein